MGAHRITLDLNRQFVAHLVQRGCRGLAGIVLAILWTLSLTLQNNKLSMLIPTLTLALGIFGASQWATSKPANIGQDRSNASINWIKDEALGFAAARKNSRPILIDMWAEWCEACKKMDVTLFKLTKKYAIGNLKSFSATTPLEASIDVVVSYFKVIKNNPWT